MSKGQICLSICGKTAEDILQKIERHGGAADLVEIRFDCMSAVERTRIISLLKSIEKPIIATFRSSDQGGRSDLSLNERSRFWKEIKGVDYCDIEEDIAKATILPGKKIVSYHSFRDTPEDIEAIYKRLRTFDPDVIKIAITVDEITDTIPLWKLIETAQNDGVDIIAVAMGDGGKATRILSPSRGALLTFGSPTADDTTAFGQVTVEDLKELYRVDKLDRDTKVFGVIGDPISSSRSPYMHNPVFASLKMNAVFISLLVKDLKGFFAKMVRDKTREVELNFGGFSVTMPHKLEIIPLLDEMDVSANRVGAVNTVEFRDGKLVGHNTDAYGFITPLKSIYNDLKGSRVVVAGAGGAARACVYALKNEGAEVAIAVRDPKKAQAFADEFDVKIISLEGPPERSYADIAVNATPLGMIGGSGNISPFKRDHLNGVKLVYDLVTRSDDTPTISLAKELEIPSIGGIEMLLAQGARQIEIWTGKKAPLKLMRNSLERYAARSL